MRTRVCRASAQGRGGFAELAAQVGLGQIGIVLSLECSRLARNNADWYRLLDLAGMTDTLIADADGIYHPAMFNDRLLLGTRHHVRSGAAHPTRVLSNSTFAASRKVDRTAARVRSGESAAARSRSAATCRRSKSGVLTTVRTRPAAARSRKSVAGEGSTGTRAPSGAASAAVATPA